MPQAPDPSQPSDDVLTIPATLVPTMLPGYLRGYHPVAQEVTCRRDRHSRWNGRLLTSIVALVSGTLGYAAGSSFFTSHSGPSANVTILHEPGMDIKEIHTGIATTFTYNRTFGADPRVGTATLEAWDSLVPRKSANLPGPFQIDHRSSSGKTREED
jgi:hypothetical protein